MLGVPDRFIELRVYVPDSTKQSTMYELGEEIKDLIYDEVEGVHDVTYEIKVEVKQ